MRRLLLKPDSLRIPHLFLLTLRDIPAGDHLKTEKTPHSLLKRDSELPTFSFLLFPPDQLRQILNPVYLPTLLKSKSAKEKNKKTACVSQAVHTGSPNPGKIRISSCGGARLLPPTLAPRPLLPVPGVPLGWRSPGAGAPRPDHSHSAPPAWAAGARCTLGA